MSSFSVVVFTLIKQTILLKVRKSQNQFFFASILPKNPEKLYKRTLLNYELLSKIIWIIKIVLFLTEFRSEKQLNSVNVLSKDFSLICAPTNGNSNYYFLGQYIYASPAPSPFPSQTLKQYVVPYFGHYLIMELLWHWSFLGIRRNFKPGKHKYH